MYLTERKTNPVPHYFKILLIISGVVIGVFICRIFITPYKINDNSMYPALKKDEIVYVLKYGKLKTGDIVLIRSPLEPDRVLIKRIVAEEEDLVEIKNKVIYKNNIKMEFPWETISVDERIFPMKFSERDNMPPLRLNRKEFFLLGDNLDYSFDGRDFGPVEQDKIIGKVILKF